jgi:hypothetical protein
MSIVSMAFLALTAGASAPAAAEPPNVSEAVAAIKRLATASPAPTTEEGIARHAGLEALVKFLDRLQVRVAVHGMTERTLQRPARRP